MRALYVSHGAPTIFVDSRDYVDILQKLGEKLKNSGIEVIIIASPHWMSEKDFLVNVSPQPDCIQDYYGFPPEFYEYCYNALNDVEFAEMLIKKGRQEGIKVSGTKNWGLDHGAWIPLYIMFPERSIPVVPVSVSISMSPAEHYRWGEVMGKTAETSGKRTLFIGTGSIIHRLDKIRFDNRKEEIYLPAVNFASTLIKLLEMRKFEEVLSISETYPKLFREAEPEGQLKTMYMALGFADNQTSVRILYHKPLYYGATLSAIEFYENDIKERWK